MKVRITKPAYEALKHAVITAPDLSSLSDASIDDFQSWTSASSKAAVAELTGFSSSNVRRIWVGRLVPKAPNGTKKKNASIGTVIVQFTHRTGSPESMFYAYVVPMKLQRGLVTGVKDGTLSVGEWVSNSCTKKKAPHAKFARVEDFLEIRA